MNVICPVMVGAFKHSTCHMLLCKFSLRLNAGEQRNGYSQRRISDDCKHLVVKEVGSHLPLESGHGGTRSFPTENSLRVGAGGSGLTALPKEGLKVYEPLPEKRKLGVESNANVRRNWK